MAEPARCKKVHQPAYKGRQRQKVGDRVTYLVAYRCLACGLWWNETLGEAEANAVCRGTEDCLCGCRRRAAG